jgi:hypothetical protein
VEFIHTATLLHDDVVDESMLRRGRPTANAVFGNAASVLVGDFLYSRAFQMMVSVGDLRVLEVLAEATNVIAEGEVLQLMNMHQPDVALESYLQVIRYKTAKLFEASARLGAVLAGAPRGGRSLRQAMAARWARPSSWSTTCSTTRATPPPWARTWATTCAKASPPCPCWRPCSAAPRGAPADPPRHRARRGGAAARDRGHRPPHRRAGGHAAGRIAGGRGGPTEHRHTPPSHAQKSC